MGNDQRFKSRLTSQRPAKSSRGYVRKTFSSLGIRNYRLYFTGQGISLCGTWMQIIGQALLVLNITNSGTALGLVTSLQYLPILILAPGGGIVADRFNKRRVLYVTQSGAGILALILAVLVATNTVQLWMVFVLAASLGLINAVDNPTRQSFIHELVGGEELRNAVTLNSIEVNLTGVIAGCQAASSGSQIVRKIAGLPAIIDVVKRFVVFWPMVVFKSTQFLCFEMSL